VPTASVPSYEAPPVAPSQLPAPDEPHTADPDERGNEEDDGPLTRTMADLYARQGLHRRALRVYRLLLEQAPDDAGLRERVEAMVALVSTASASVVADTGGVTTSGRPTDAEMETLAQDWAEGPRETGDLSTPFAWTVQPAQPSRAPSGLPVREYFRTLLDWEPAAPEQEAEDRQVVPIESLAPAVVPVSSLAPGPTGAEVAPVAATVEDPVVVAIETLAPDVVDIAALAPEDVT
jgi:hypothetical protein